MKLLPGYSGTAQPGQPLALGFFRVAFVDDSHTDKEYQSVHPTFDSVPCFHHPALFVALELA